MNDASTPLPSAGWYRDPAGGAAPRWWNGTEWAAANTVPADATPLPTSAPTANAPTATVAPVAANYSHTAPSALSDAATNTWQIWVLALLPLIIAPSYLLIDVSSWLPAVGEDAFTAQLRQYSDPGYLLALVGGWLIYGVSIPLAIFDRRILSARGIDRPFHWAFIFLGSLVYVIGRSVVARRRTGHGIAPLWAATGVQVLSIVAGGIFVVNLVNATMNYVTEFTY